MFSRLRLSRFCFCCSLRTGAYIIAVLGWIGNLTYGLSYQKGATGETITVSLLAICMLGVSGSLVYGIYTDNRYYIIPWLGVKLVECSFLTIVTLICFFDLFVEYDVTEPFILFVFFGSITGFFWYFFLCIWSLYMDLGETVDTILPTAGDMPVTESIPLTTQGPFQQMPGQQQPMNGVALQSYPMQGLPMQQYPMEEVPLQQAPMQLSSQQGITQGILMQQQPIQEVPMQQVPMQVIPMQQVPKQTVPMSQNVSQQIVQQNMMDLTRHTNATENATNPQWL